MGILFCVAPFCYPIYVNRRRESRTNSFFKSLCLSFSGFLLLCVSFFFLFLTNSPDRSYHPATFHWIKRFFTGLETKRGTRLGFVYFLSDQKSSSRACTSGSQQRNRPCKKVNKPQLSRQSDLNQPPTSDFSYFFFYFSLYIVTRQRLPQRSIITTAAVAAERLPSPIVHNTRLMNTHACSYQRE